VRTLHDDELEDVPEHASRAAFIDGIAKVGDQLIILLDTDSLLDFALDDGTLELAA
jgi:chemotaxis signal transduction protein